jgi:hypothetical protein
LLFRRLLPQSSYKSISRQIDISIFDTHQFSISLSNFRAAAVGAAATGTAATGAAAKGTAATGAAATGEAAAAAPSSSPGSRSHGSSSHRRNPITFYKHERNILVDLLSNNPKLLFVTDIELSIYR